MHIYGRAISLANNGKVPACIVFGDSIVDSGNNDYINTIGKANFPPYGRDFDGGVATGRYCNGKIPSDLIAEDLGIKELVPPYLDPTLQINDLLTGVSFAAGAAGYDPQSSQIAEIYDLGARKIAVISAPPCGCLPSQRTLRGGFQVSNRGCCGTGNIEVSFLCTEYDKGTCEDASKYVFWDSFHPTEAAYRYVVRAIITKLPLD
ncbi:hypothetical protein KSS87_006895 [Heliosperma pusillum]|nr:hypothetical protein KSS87_006895 [Heliosperma pusillum]